MSAKPIPDGVHSVSPYLLVKNGAKLIDFLQQAFGAEQIEPQGDPMPASLYLLCS